MTERLRLSKQFLSSKNPDNIQGKLIPGTKHPVNYYMITDQETYDDQNKKADAVFISCTALRTVEVLDQIEKRISKYVISSNQAIIWDCLRSVNINNSISGYGKLFFH